MKSFRGGPQSGSTRRSPTAALLAALIGVATAGVGVAAGVAQQRPEAAAPAASSAAAQPGRRPASPAPGVAVTGPQRITGLIEPGGAFLFPQLMEFDNAAGKVGVSFSGEPFNTADHPFFRKGANGRACVSCHQPADAMSLSIATIRKRWEDTAGRDPIFNPVDGANCPNLPQGDPKSHSLLLERGLFRIALPWPGKQPDGAPVEPEFTIEVASDPTGCNLSPEYGLNSKTPTISVYRRPRMAGNLRFVEKTGQAHNFKTSTPLERDPVTGERSSMALMSDARATSLRAQALDAAVTHMGLKSLPAADVAGLVDFERKLHVAQNASHVGGRFDVPGTPKALGVRAMAEGESQVVGNDRDAGVFFFFDEWKAANPGAGLTEAQKFRASVARGYDIFFLKPIWIADTYGINHMPLGNPYKQTCAFCHSTQLTGGDDVPGWMDIGVNNFPHAAASPDLPTFKITCKADAPPHPFLGRVIYTRDPGRALISGKCRDVGALVMQQFRGMAARAPYFSNGGAKSIREIVDFYDRRWDIGYTDQEKEDLINFMSVL